VAVGGVRGGGKRGGPGGARGAGGPSGASKAGGAGFGAKVDRTDSLAGASREVASSAVAAPDPITARALELARQLKAGEISSRDEATKRLISDILKEKLRMQSKALTQRISDALSDDPRLNQTLDRLWAQGTKR
jgi:hypothetical protein